LSKRIQLGRFEDALAAFAGTLVRDVTTLAPLAH
jgi:hypothetical protein